MRLVLEPIATRLATKHVADSELDNFDDERKADLEPAPSRGILIARLNSGFHRAIARLSGSARLERTIATPSTNEDG